LTPVGKLHNWPFIAMNPGTHTRESAHLVNAVASLIFTCFFVLAASGQSIPGTDHSDNIKGHASLAARFKAGDTNVPLLSMTWFSGGSSFCSVERSGKVISGHSGFYNSGRITGPLDATNRHLLIETMNRLPPPPNELLPDRRQILVSGIRSNKWFHAVYDRANIPEPVSKLYAITGAQIEAVTIPPASPAPSKP
jgi:hypothetical protein